MAKKTIGKRKSLRIPQREAWLFKNPTAKAAVLEGLAKAKAGKFATKPPDLAADKRAGPRKS